MKRSILTFLIALTSIASSHAQAHKGDGQYYGTLNLSTGDTVVQGQTLAIAYMAGYDQGEGQPTSLAATLLLDVDNQYMLKEVDNLRLTSPYFDTLRMTVSYPEGYYTLSLRYNGTLLASKTFVVLPDHAIAESTVWPGDANGDGVVDLYDPLALAVAYGHTGIKRPAATTNWKGELCLDWDASFPDGVNYSHADCNGNGLIDWDDIYPISKNYTNPRSFAPNPVTADANAPVLHFDLGGIVFAQGKTIKVPLRLQSNNVPLTDFYGIATNIQLEGVTPTDRPQLDFKDNVLSSQGNYAYIHSNTDIDLMVARTDHKNVSGDGIVAMVSFTLPNDLPNDEPIIFRLKGTRIIDKDGNILSGYNVKDDTAYLNTASVANAPNNSRVPVIVPNPSVKQANLVYAFPKSGTIEMRITDLAGKQVSSGEITVTPGQHAITLPTLSRGIYLVNLVCKDWNYEQTIRWQQL